MQEQDQAFEKMQSINQPGRVEGIHSFQEVAYPPSRWQRVLFAMPQFILGIVVGLALLWLAYTGGKITGGNLVYIGLTVTSIPCMILRKTRFFGFGLLVILLAIPVLFLVISLLWDLSFSEIPWIGLNLTH